MKAVVEVERKFTVGAQTAPPPLDGVAGVSGVRQLPERTLDAVYFDTAGHDLAAHGITLRRRAGGTDAGWHLKLPAGPDARTELRAPLGDPADVPAELHDMVLATVRDRPLAPVARISTVRAGQLLLGPDAAVLAEFCDDTVTAVATGGPRQRWREWEVELAGGDRGLLDRLGDRLVAFGATPAGHTSKLARALGPDRRARPEAAARHPVAALVDELPGWDRAVRNDDDDAVHQLRVTLRKIRSLLQVISDEPAITGELRWLAGLLGVARDAEVLGLRYRRQLDRLASELVRGPVAQRLVSGAAQRYQAGRAASLIAMRSARYFRLLDALDALVAQPSFGVHTADAASAGIETAYRRLRKAVKAARVAPPTARDTALHRIRKAAKRLRYVAAAADAPRIAAQAKVVQTLLGEHQDSVVSRAHLLAQANAAHTAGEDTFSYGLLYRREEELARSCQDQLDGALHRLGRACHRP